jgi:hypothetical protein
VRSLRLLNSKPICSSGEPLIFPRQSLERRGASSENLDLFCDHRPAVLVMMAGMRVFLSSRQFEQAVIRGIRDLQVVLNAALDLERL